MTGHRRRRLLALSPILNVLEHSPRESSQVAIVLGFEMAGATDMTIIDKSLAGIFPTALYIQYTGFCRFRECTYALVRPILVEGANAERT